MEMYEPTDTSYYTASGHESANHVKYEVYHRDGVEAREAFADDYQLLMACDVSYAMTMFRPKSRQDLMLLFKLSFA